MNGNKIKFTNGRIGLAKSLLGEYIHRGFFLSPINDLLMVLDYQGKQIGIFNQLNTDATTIQKSCKVYLEKIGVKDAT